MTDGELMEIMGRVELSQLNTDEKPSVPLWQDACTLARLVNTQRKEIAALREEREVMRQKLEERLEVWEKFKGGKMEKRLSAAIVVVEALLLLLKPEESESAK